MFKSYAENPELATLINALVLKGNVAPTSGRADLAAIFIPDVIKVDLSTGRARLPGGGASNTVLADDAGYSRLSIFGGDVLESAAAGHPFRLPGSAIGAEAGKFYVPGGWPNGRRFGEDVIDIGVTAIISDLRAVPLTIRSADGIDNVNGNGTQPTAGGVAAAKHLGPRRGGHGGGRSASRGNSRIRCWSSIKARR